MHLAQVLTISCFLITGSELAAQESARLKLKITWEGAPPRSVFRSTRDEGDVSVKPLTNPLLVDEQFPTASSYTMFRLDGVAGRSYLSFLPRYSDKFFHFRLKMPTGTDCHTENVVRPIIRAVGQNDVSTVVSATILARHLVEARACGPGNDRSLREAFYNGYRRLTIIGDVFAMPDIEWGSYATRAQLAQREARERRLQSLYAETQRMRDEGDYGRLDTRISQLDALMNVTDWQPIFSSVGVTVNDLRHLEVQSLYNRAVPLRNSGNLQEAQGYSAQLAKLAQDDRYSEIFDRRPGNRNYAGVTRGEAIDIDQGIQARIEAAQAGIAQP